MSRIDDFFEYLGIVLLIINFCLYVSSYRTKNGFVAIYAVKPITLSEKPVGYVAVQDIILKSEFKNFKSKPKRIVIEASILAAIESNLVLNGTTYKFIEDNKRYNNSITYGDYNNDGAIDFAIILDTPDNADSVFLDIVSMLQVLYCNYKTQEVTIR